MIRIVHGVIIIIKYMPKMIEPKLAHFLNTKIIIITVTLLREMHPPPTHGPARPEH